ncbi:cytochrome P450 [Arthrobacter sp. NPDC058127]|uniref:cytochrome P450 n=1 Tax=Arthrobacter sp. NPDC058127 TaxID=3346351 RepID=UPI0036EB9D8E
MSTVTPADPLSADLAELVRVEDPAFYDEDQYAVYSRLRDVAPCFRYEPLDIHLISRMSDIRYVSTHPEIFSNTGGLTLNQVRLARSGSVEAFERFNDPEGELVITKDAPRHGAVRKIMTPVLAPRYLSTFQTTLERLCREVLDDVPLDEPFDFVTVVAQRLPLLVASALLGVAETDIDIPKMQTWVDALEDLTRVEDTSDLEEPGQRFDEMKRFLADQIEVKRTAPGNDLMSTFLTAHLDGNSVSDAVVLAHISTLMSNGGTTRLMFTSLAARFADNPELIAQCRAEPDLLHAVIEECLRMDPPARGFVRTVRDNVTVGGVDLVPGDRVYMLYPSANRDPEAFDRPDEFDPRRTWTASHATFGFGSHFCLGSGLARIEAQLLFAEFIQRFDAIERSGPAKPYPHVQLNGLASLPVTVRPRSGALPNPPRTES